MSRAADTSGALADRADMVARSLLGDPSSSTRRELRWGARGSFVLRIGDGSKRGKWFDHERAEGGDLLDLVARKREVSIAEAIRIAERDYLGGTPPIPRQSPPASVQVDDAGRIDAALRMWKAATSLGCTLGERYFVESRGLNVLHLDLSHVLRWHAGERCIVALMTDATTNEATGIHRTYLDPDGTKRERKMLGRKGCIRLSHDDAVTLGLGLVEGIEDGLAVLLSGWVPVWAAADAGAMARFPVLAGVECLTLFADADMAGTNAAQRCSARWIEAGKEARISPPVRTRNVG